MVVVRHRGEVITSVKQPQHPLTGRFSQNQHNLIILLRRKGVILPRRTRNGGGDGVSDGEGGGGDAAVVSRPSRFAYAVTVMTITVTHTETIVRTRLGGVDRETVRTLLVTIHSNEVVTGGRIGDDDRHGRVERNVSVVETPPRWLLVEFNVQIAVHTRTFLLQCNLNIRGPHGLEVVIIPSVLKHLSSHIVVVWKGGEHRLARVSGETNGAVALNVVGAGTVAFSRAVVGAHVGRGHFQDGVGTLSKTVDANVVHPHLRVRRFEEMLGVDGGVSVVEGVEGRDRTEVDVQVAVFVRRIPLLEFDREGVLSVQERVVGPLFHRDGPVVSGVVRHFDHHYGAARPRVSVITRTIRDVLHGVPQTVPLIGAISDAVLLHGRLDCVVSGQEPIHTNVIGPIRMHDLDFRIVPGGDVPIIVFVSSRQLS